MTIRGSKAHFTAGLVLTVLYVNPLPLMAEESTANDIPEYYGYLYIGNNTGSGHSRELDSIDYKGGSPYEWGLGLGRYLSHTISIEGTFEYWGERFERQDANLIPGTANNVIQVGGLGVSIAGLLNYRYTDLHGYVGIGAGLFYTGVLVTEPGTGLLTTDNAPTDKLRPGYHGVVGLDYRVEENHWVGLEVKYRILRVDFGEYTHGEVDVGGTCILLRYRHSPR